MFTARDIMKTDFVTIKKDAPIKELVNLFAEHKVNGAPVVNDDGKIVGIVTESDLIEQNKNLHMPTVIAIFDAAIQLEGQKKLSPKLNV